jgi:DNA-binding transcriptional LysR family regulator
MARKPQSSRYRSVIARLKLRHLRLIEAIVEAKRVSAAAETLNISQPAVSKGLREVESILGVALFERGPAGLTLTHYGRAVLAHGQVIQSEIRHVTDEIEALSSGATGVVAIGALLVSQPSLVPKALALLRERDVTAVAHVIDGRQEELMAALRAGELDVLVGRLPPVEQRERLVQEVLLYEPIVVVSGSRNPLAERRSVGYHELAQADWIFPSPESTVYNQIMQLFTQHGVSRPRSYVQSVSFLMMRTLMVENDMLAAAAFGSRARRRQWDPAHPPGSLSARAARRRYHASERPQAVGARSRHHPMPARGGKVDRARKQGICA